MNISKGINDSERHLAELGENSFLSLWCYPNLYKSRGISGDKKELCDMLVVFKNHVLIFSDKKIDFKHTGNLNIDWSRWVRKAIFKSANQIYGAERFIRECPTEIFIDKECTKKFPLQFPSNDKIIFHRILVTRVAKDVKKFREYIGGSGTLMIEPNIIGKDIEDNPFFIGTIDEKKGFIHVLDDVVLDILFYELDTITDFVRYLEKKEKFICDKRLGFAAGEEELLGFYLANSSPGKEPSFKIEDRIACISEGFYSKIISLPQYRAGKQADKKSYFIDAFIEHFAKIAFTKTWYFSNTKTFDDSIRGLREFASETRLGRRVLANGILEKLSILKEGERGVRLILSPTNPKTLYVWLVEPVPSQANNYQEYREHRIYLLTCYCKSAKLLKPAMDIIVGIATDSPIESRSDDIAYLDTTSWNEKDYTEAHEIREELGLLKNVNSIESKEYQFPID